MKGLYRKSILSLRWSCTMLILIALLFYALIKIGSQLLPDISNLSVHRGGGNLFLEFATAPPGDRYGAQQSNESDSLTPSRAKNFTILLGIFTVASKTELRSLLRMVYGVQSSPEADFTVKFVLGKLKTKKEMTLIGLEALRFGDVLVLDCDENLNQGKSYTFFSTIARRGLKHDYVMKLDDDSYVRVPNLASSLREEPRDDLYYGYVIPCANQNAHSSYMAGMGYLLSWDIVEWIGSSSIAREKRIGTEDRQLGRWLDEGGKAKHRVSKKPLFYDHPEFGGKCAHELVKETILIHQLKNAKRWEEVISFFESDRLYTDVITNSSVTTSFSLSVSHTHTAKLGIPL